MKHIALILSLTLASPAAAQTEDSMREGLDQLGEGSRLFMEGLMDNLGPLFEDLEGLGGELAPLMEDLGAQLGETFEGLNAYHPPEFLPNGDIILRKKQTAPQPEEGEAPLEAPIDL